MTIRRVVEPPAEERKQVDAPTWDVGDYTDQQIASASDAANKLPGSIADPNMVQVVWPVLIMPVTGAALDFGSAAVVKVKLGDLIASQTWIKRDRLLAHIQKPGTRADGPFVQLVGGLPFVAENNVIIDGHHALTALFLLTGNDRTFQTTVWSLPIGVATGHPR